MTSTRSLAVVAVAALALAACGDDEPGDSSASEPAAEAESGGSGSLSAADQALADAIAADLSADDDAGFAEVFDTQCMAEGTVLALGGAEAIESEYGVTPETVGSIDDTELSADDARAVARAYGQCGDFVELFVRSFMAQDIAEDTARCLLDGVDNDQIEVFVAAGFTGDSTEAENEFSAAVFANAGDCGVDL